MRTCVRAMHAPYDHDLNLWEGLIKSMKMASLACLKIFFIFLFVCIVSSEDTATPTVEVNSDTQNQERKVEEKKLYTIEGRIDIDDVDVSVWGPRTRVLVDGGKFVGYVKTSGEFQVTSVPSGSYTVEVASPNHVFDQVRVDISGKTGKIRARKLNLLKPNAVSSLPYPLKFHTSKPADFFQKRESWNIMSIVKNPMVYLHVHIHI